RRGNRELIELKRRKFLGDKIIIRTNVRQVSQFVRSRNRKLGGVVQTRIKEPAFAMHFQVGHERIPVSDRSPRASPGVLVEARQPEGVWNQRRARDIRASDNAIRDLLRIERFAIQKDLGIKFSWSPTAEHCSQRRYTNAKKVGHWLEVGGGRRNAANI